MKRLKESCMAMKLGKTIQCIPSCQPKIIQQNNISKGSFKIWDAEFQEMDYKKLKKLKLVLQQDKQNNFMSQKSIKNID